MPHTWDGCCPYMCFCVHIYAFMCFCCPYVLHSKLHVTIFPLFITRIQQGSFMSQVVSAAARFLWEALGRPELTRRSTWEYMQGIYALHICRGIYARGHLCKVSILKKLPWKYNRTFFSLPDTQQTTMVRRSTGGRGERLSTSTSSPGEAHNVWKFEFC